MLSEKGKGVRIRTLTLTATAVVALSGFAFASAQERQDEGAEETTTRTLEQVIVTARKREENLVSVPISVSVVAGADLARLGVQQLDQALQSEPGVNVTPTPVGDLLYIRGIGSGQNQGFEMSVGTFVDGVYFGRGQSSRHSFLDIDRIEVLKGPQPILFGKNTIAGALNITTRKPTDSVEISIDEYIEPEFGTFRTTGVLSGPLSDTLRGRLVLRSYKTDGYVKNTFTNTDEPARDDLMGRAILVWEPSANLEVTLKGEYGDADMKGGRSQISKASPTLQQLILPVDPDAEYNLDYEKSGPGVSPFFNREFEKNQTYNGMLTVVWDLDDHEITSVSSYAGYDMDYAFDSDFTPLDFIHQVWSQHWHAWAQELRFASTSDQKFTYQGGMYLASEKLKSNKVNHFNFSQTPLPFGPVNRLFNFGQKTDSWSVFAEGTYNATDALSFTLGYRHTDDQKTTDKAFAYADFGSMVPNPNITLYSALGLGVAHAYTGIEKNTDNDSFAFRIRYQPNDIMYYASYTQGFKAGGFDEADTSGNLDSIIFEDEFVNSYEAGLKAEVLDGRLRSQLAVFYNEYDDLQVSQFDGVAALIVGNAAAAVSSGVEVQTQYAATNQLTLSFSGSYLDAYYDSYAAGPCPFGQGATCDLSGKTLTFAPDWSGTAAARWEDSLSNGWNYVLDGRLYATTSFFTEADLDANVEQGGFAKLDASVSLSSPDDKWLFSLIGKNLTDETTAHFGNDIPLSNVLGNNYQHYVDPPRTIALQARYRFR